jgi:GntP family gluconate:H+ symporter
MLHQETAALATWYPLIVLAIGLAVVIGGIVWLRVHAFLALLAAAIAVSMLAPGPWVEKAQRVADAFGGAAAKIGIVIALAAIIGNAMTASGAADRIVRMFFAVFGEKRSASALLASGFTLAIPVFFDTVFYLLLPLVRSVYRQTGKHYVKLLMAVAASATAHALAPPTPGPLIAANTLGVDLGLMILMGCAVGFPASLVGLMYAGWADARLPDLQPPDDGSDPPALEPNELPPLSLSLAPIAIPVVLISMQTGMVAYLGRLAERGEAASPGIEAAAAMCAFLGNPNMALFLAAVVALFTFWHVRRPARGVIPREIEDALTTAGVIILITAAGGAFGAMLQQAQLAGAIETLFGDAAAGGLGLLLLAFGVSALIRFAQGSTTTAMMVTSAMFSAMLRTSDAVPIDGGALGFHPVYLATAIGGGGLALSWMNDSGFWIFSKMGGLTEVQCLRTWSVLLTILGVASLAMTLLLATLLPLV